MKRGNEYISNILEKYMIRLISKIENGHDRLTP